MHEVQILGVWASGATGGGLGYNVGASGYRTDDYRDHCAAEHALGNAKLTFRPHAGNKLRQIAEPCAVS